jgi:leader peptidase (prepilin peptidase)/N-methyltransferase
MITVEDARRRVIPDIWLWPLLLAGLYVFGGYEENIVAAIAGYALGFALMWALKKKDALGYGDVKLLSVAGLWLGINGLSVAVVSACLIGIAWGLARKQRYVPFAPFLFLGTAIYYLTKEILWQI